MIFIMWPKNSFIKLDFFGRLEGIYTLIIQTNTINKKHIFFRPEGSMKDSSLIVLAGHLVRALHGFCLLKKLALKFA